MDNLAHDQLMVELGNLTDDQLTKRLKDEFNYEPGPITQTTRNVYVNKLAKLIREKNGQTPVGKQRRSTGAGIMTTSTPKGQKKLLNAIEEENGVHEPASVKKVIMEEVGATKRSPRSSTRRKTIAFQPDRDEMPKTSSPRRSIVVPPVSFSGKKKPMTGKESNGETNAAPILAAYSSAESDEDMDLLTGRATSKRKGNTTPPRPLLSATVSSISSAKVPLPRLFPSSSTNNASTLSSRKEYSFEMPSLIRPPLRRSSPRKTNKTDANSRRLTEVNLANFSDSSDGETESQDTNSTQTIRDRLLRHRRITSRRSSPISLSPSQSGSLLTQATPGEYSLMEDDQFYHGSSSNWISKTILGLIIAFFLFIFSFYIFSRLNFSLLPTKTNVLAGMDFGTSYFEPYNVDDLTIPICSDGLTKGECINDKLLVEPALKIVDDIKNIIRNRYVIYFCGEAEADRPDKYSTSPFEYRVKDLSDLIRSMPSSYGKNLSTLHTDISNAFTLIALNQEKFKIAVMGEEGEEFLKIDENYPVSLSLKCRIHLFIQKAFVQIGGVLAAAFVIWVTWKLVMNRKRIANEEQELVMDLVEKSLELLQSPDEPQSMPVIHIRDTLLTALERKSNKHKRIWNKVVKFIEESESRVKVEIENIDGEDYKTWKWVANSTSSSPDKGSTVMKTGSIEWQGQAFGETTQPLSVNTQDNSVSMPTTSNQSNNGKPVGTFFTAPTRYLKVRNMFDQEWKASDPINWKMAIQNAILEKVSSMTSDNNGHGIFHIHIDENSTEGLVYVMCNSISSSTVAFHALHGWWCQKKLVSVRFLKEERYFSRFPETRTLTKPLTVIAINASS